MDATTDIKEVRTQMESLARRLLATSTGLFVTVERFQLVPTADRRTGWYFETMPFGKWLEYREQFAREHGLRDGLLYAMDTAYINAESVVAREREHIAQQMLHLVDKLSLIYRAAVVEVREAALARSPMPVLFAPAPVVGAPAGQADSAPSAADPEEREVDPELVLPDPEAGEPVPEDVGPDDPGDDDEEGWEEQDDEPAPRGGGG